MLLLVSLMYLWLFVFGCGFIVSCDLLFLYCLLLLVVLICLFNSGSVVLCYYCCRLCW